MIGLPRPICLVLRLSCIIYSTIGVAVPVSNAIRSRHLEDYAAVLVAEIGILHIRRCLHDNGPWLVVQPAGDSVADIHAQFGAS